MTNYSTKSKRKIYVGTKLTGEISDGVFSKVVRGSRHFLTDPPAISIAVESLDEIEHEQVKQIEVTDSETGIIYHTDLENFKRHAFSVQRANFEPQRAMRLEYWTVNGGQRPRRRSKKARSAGSIAWQPAAPKKKRTAMPADVDAMKEKPASMQQLGMFSETLQDIEVKHRRRFKRTRKAQPWPK